MHNHLLKRQNLMVELEKIFEFPLSLVVAGMGYGKTLAVRNFLNVKNVEYIWLSIDKSEISPYTLWDTFVVQLGKKQFQIGNKLRNIGFPFDYFHINKVINGQGHLYIQEPENIPYQASLQKDHRLKLLDKSELNKNLNQKIK